MRMCVCVVEEPHHHQDEDNISSVAFCRIAQIKIYRPNGEKATKKLIPHSRRLNGTVSILSSLGDIEERPFVCTENSLSSNPNIY